jgi:hypothetical protein
VSIRWVDINHLVHIVDGMFSPEIAKYAQICSKAKEREYRYEQKLYYGCLLRDVLTNRQVSNILFVIVC